MKTNNLVIKILLFLIVVGVWVIALQNAGMLPTDHKVYVKDGYIYSDVNGSVEIERGNIEIDNTVSVSIDEVLGPDGRKYYLENH